MYDPLNALIVAGLFAGLGGLVFWPHLGLLARWRRGRRMTERVFSEDALKHIYECENAGRGPTVQSIAGAVQMSVNEVAELLPKMERGGLLRVEGDHLRLTPRGRAAALHIIRAHRLWERYLADETGVAEAEWHAQAERHEHSLSPVEADELSAHLGHPTHDPHGDPIPTPTVELTSHGGRPLTTIAPDASVRIVHLEDEPPVLFAQLVANGLHPGMEVRVLENSPQQVRFWAQGQEYVLEPIVATNVSVVPLPEQVPLSADPGDRLAQLEPGEAGEVVSISPVCRGLERRRMMDLGIVPGTVVTAEMRSPGSDPTAYRVRGALIALRREQANHIHVRKLEERVTE